MFKVGHIYKRSLIHDEYGGSRQNGISPSAKFPYIFIFTGLGGKQFGYKDRWENKNVFSYTGEGQTGDMDFIRGNLALRDHLINGRKVFLFKYVKKAFVEFLGEVEFLEYGFFETFDRNNNQRTGIKFFFKRSGVKLYDIPEELYKVEETSQIEYSQILKPNKTEREGLVITRVGQGAYRKSILHRWEYKCAVTHYSNANILIASHIKPWRNAIDLERLDVDNGILLSPDYDALFDKHLISFENSGKIILSEQIKNSDYKKLGITGTERIRDLSEGNHSYLENHRLNLK